MVSEKKVLSLSVSVLSLAGSEIIVPFFADYQENYSKEPINDDEGHDSG
jgi:hypothetical protein